MIMTLTIGGNAYNGLARAANGFVGVDGLTRTIDGYDELEFTVDGCGPNPAFVPGLPVTLDIAADDGSNSQRRFVGDLQRGQPKHGDDGWQTGYTCTGLKRRGDYITLIGPDGTGTAAFNLPPDDDFYLSGTAGMTVGQICITVLQAYGVQAALAEAGIGNYGYAQNGAIILPAQTTTDFNQLGVVPPTPVRLSGQGVLTILSQFIQAWHPQYFLWVEPTGLIRCVAMGALPTVTLTLPGDTGTGDPVDNLAYAMDCEGCYTAVSIAGLDIDVFLGSLRYGTITPAWSAANQGAWTVDDFLQPSDAADNGAVSGVSSTSCTVQSDDPKAFWSAQFWQTRGGVIQLLSTVAAGIDVSQTRTITACTQLTPGGTATITWDASQPISSTAYSRYRIVGLNSPLAEVGRRFHICEPSTGKLDTANWVGAHLYPHFPKPIWWAQNSSQLQITSPAAIVQWSADRSGKPPYYELPVNIEVDRNLGQILLAQPDVVLSAAYSTVQQGFPATEALGAPHDVLVAIPYNRGNLNANAPLTGYSGTAYTKFGVQRTLVIPMDSFTAAGDLASYRQLAAEKLAVVQDVVYSGSIAHHDYPAGFDPLAVGYSLLLAISGTTSPLDGIPLPVRSVRQSWPNTGPDLTRFEFTFSNQKRPFEGDALYLHPGLASSSFGLHDDGDSFGPGAIDGVGDGGIAGAPGAASVDAALVQAATPAPIDSVAPIGSTAGGG